MKNSGCERILPDIDWSRSRHSIFHHQVDLLQMTEIALGHNQIAQRDHVLLVEKGLVFSASKMLFQLLVVLQNLQGWPASFNQLWLRVKSLHA